MRQGEIWYVNLDPVKGSEQAGYRPVVIISGNMMNKYLKVVIACPLTTSIKNYKGNIILEPDEQNGLKTTSEILLFHIRSISKDRMIKKIGTVSKEHLDELINNLNDILRY